MEQNLTTVEDLAENVKPMFYTRMRLGEFDPPEMNPYSTIPMSVVLSAEHCELAVQAACMSLVLLKNDNNLLPVSRRFARIAVRIIANDLACFYQNFHHVDNKLYWKKLPRSRSD